MKTSGLDPDMRITRSVIAGWEEAGADDPDAWGEKLLIMASYGMARLPCQNNVVGDWWQAAGGSNAFHPDQQLLGRFRPVIFSDEEDDEIKDDEPAVVGSLTAIVEETPPAVMAPQPDAVQPQMIDPERADILTRIGDLYSDANRGERISTDQVKAYHAMSTEDLKVAWDNLVERIKQAVEDDGISELAPQEGPGVIVLTSAEAASEAPETPAAVILHPDTAPEPVAAMAPPATPPPSTTAPVAAEDPDFEGAFSYTETMFLTLHGFPMGPEVVAIYRAMSLAQLTEANDGLLDQLGKKDLHEKEEAKKTELMPMVIELHTEARGAPSDKDVSDFWAMSFADLQKLSDQLGEEALAIEKAAKEPKPADEAPLGKTVSTTAVGAASPPIPADELVTAIPSAEVREAMMADTPEEPAPSGRELEGGLDEPHVREGFARESLADVPEPPESGGVAVAAPPAVVQKVEKGADVKAGALILIEGGMVAIGCHKLREHLEAQGNATMAFVVGALAGNPDAAAVASFIREKIEV
jgi:hypothetical protein